MKVTLENINQYLLFEAIVGSQAYGLSTPESDVDIKGVFLLPNDYLLVGDYIPQISDEKNNITYYELNRFMELIKENNPNIIELLFSNDDMIQYCHPLFKNFILNNKEHFLTKKLEHTFGGYAISQIKKARGLNKKIVNPIEKEKKTPLDFCHIFDKETGYMMLANQWLKKMGYKQEEIGLAQMPNGVELYKIYRGNRFKGIIGKRKNTSTSIRHSSIPKKYPLEGFLVYNKNGYVCYCKEYKEYWEWVEKRNPVRYNDNISHNQNYDGKNMLHCNRLLDMAIEVGEGKGINLVRPDKEWLLMVKKGQIPYDEIMLKINEKSEKLKAVYSNCELLDNVDDELIKNIILTIRKEVE